VDAALNLSFENWDPLSKSEGSLPVEIHNISNFGSTISY